MRAFLLVAALGACFALAGGVPAPDRSALVAGGETVLFARSCEACDPEAYCEFTHPSAPADHVACVTIPTFRSLFRRYYSAWTAQTLGVGQRCTGAGKGIYLGDGVPEADVPNFANQCRNLCDDVTGSAPGLVAKVRRMGHRVLLLLDSVDVHDRVGAAVQRVICRNRVLRSFAPGRCELRHSIWILFRHIAVGLGAISHDGLVPQVRGGVGTACRAQRSSTSGPH